ncbi:uncharacterized protein METZ01_LOCUS118128, partial [marine metagenome]
VLQDALCRENQQPQVKGLSSGGVPLGDEIIDATVTVDRET